MKNQKGVSYIAILIAIIGFAFIAKVFIAVWEPYFDDRMIDTQITELMQRNSGNLSSSKFIEQMNQRLSMNNVQDISFEDIATVTQEGGLRVNKEYEVRKPFLLNIDLVLKFEKSFDQSSVQAK